MKNIVSESPQFIELELRLTSRSAGRIERKLNEMSHDGYKLYKVEGNIFSFVHTNKADRHYYVFSSNEYRQAAPALTEKAKLSDCTKQIFVSDSYTFVAELVENINPGHLYDLRKAKAWYSLKYYLIILGLISAFVILGVYFGLKEFTPVKSLIIEVCVMSGPAIAFLISAAIRCAYELVLIVSQHKHNNYTAC